MTKHTKSKGVLLVNRLAACFCRAFANGSLSVYQLVDLKYKPGF